MRKMVLLAAMMAMAALMLAAAPALAADDNDRRDNDNRNHDNRNHDNRNHDNRDFGDFIDEFCEDSDGDFVCDFDEFCEDSDGNLICDLEEFCEDFDGNFFCDDEEDLFDGFGDLGDEIFQTSDQQAESGDADQSFDISGSGANSNQCVGAQGVSNTGNAQNTINILNIGGEIDDFELDELESSLTVSPTNTTTCDQEVNQAATAFGGYDHGGGSYYY
jgi:hypothetical protein